MKTKTSERMMRWILPVLVLAAISIMPTAAKAQKVAFTMDDLPLHSALPQNETRVEIAAKIIKAFKEAGLPPVYGMVNGVGLEYEPKSEPVLAMWLDAGNLLANHTYTHLNLNEHTAAEFEANMLKNEPVIDKRMAGKDWHWLRFPYLAEGDTPAKKAEIRQWLGAHGYKVAGVTLSFGDYMWNEPYARCVAKGDQKAITQLEDAYLKAAADNLDYEQGLSQKLYHRDIPYVLLMHIGAFDARMMPRLLAMYKAKGVTFVTLDEAEKDEFYKPETDMSVPWAPDNLEGQAWSRGMNPGEQKKPEINFDTICK